MGSAVGSDRWLSVDSGDSAVVWRSWYAAVHWQCRPGQQTGSRPAPHDNTADRPSVTGGHQGQRPDQPRPWCDLGSCSRGSEPAARARLTPPPPSHCTLPRPPTVTQQASGPLPRPSVRERTVPRSLHTVSPLRGPAADTDGFRSIGSGMGEMPSFISTSGAAHWQSVV